MRARDEHELYFRRTPRRPTATTCWPSSTTWPSYSGTKDVFGAHNVALAYRNWLSGDAAEAHRVLPEDRPDGTGEIIHDFTDGTGTPGSSATSTRTSPRRPGRSTPCSRRRSSSRSSSSNARWNRPSRSSAWPRSGSRQRGRLIAASR